MSITINWTPESERTYRVYRADKYEGPFELLHTDTDGTGSYVDTSAPARKLLYYRVDSEGASGVRRGFPEPYAFHADPGPGPQTIAVGSWECGYFGTITASELLGAKNILSEIPLSGISHVTANQVSFFHKLAFEGRILFIPNKPIVLSIAKIDAKFREAYEAGLLHQKGFPRASMHPDILGLPEVTIGVPKVYEGYNYTLYNLGTTNLDIPTYGNSGYISITFQRSLLKQFAGTYSASPLEFVRPDHVLTGRDYTSVIPRPSSIFNVSSTGYTLAETLRPSHNVTSHRLFLAGTGNAEDKAKTDSAGWVFNYCLELET